MVDPAGLQLESPEFREIIAKEERNQNFYTYSSQEFKTALLDINPEANDKASSRKLSDDDLLTLPATIPAYSLILKCWGLIDVDRFEEIEWKDDIYDMLQMETEQKELVRGIIESHQASSSSFDDFIPGKGRGLVFLLHGPPGCGKTLTAGESYPSAIRSTIA